MQPALKLAIGSIILGVVVLGLKTLAWWMTGSIALYSDALESIVNVATAIAALVAIRIAARPADADHPYGHHKAEFLSAIFEGVMIILAAILILIKAGQGLIAPAPLVAPAPALAVNLLASVLNGSWCFLLISRGRALRSPALVADGHHLLSDVVSSVGVTLGLVLAVATGWALLDPLMAALVALNILWSGWRVMARSMSGLLDESLPEGVLAEISAVILREATGAVEAHDLRTRHAGQATFIDFHLVVSGTMSVAASHEICDRIEAALRATVENCIVTIHVEPEHKAKHGGTILFR